MALLVAAAADIGTVPSLQTRRQAQSRPAASGHVPIGELSYGGFMTLGHQWFFVALMQRSICDIEQQNWPVDNDDRYRQRCLGELNNVTHI